MVVGDYQMRLCCFPKLQLEALPTLVAFTVMISVFAIVLMGAAGINGDNYERIQVGMTYEQIVAIMGSKGQEGSRVEDSVTYVWKPRFGIQPMIMVTFRNGKVVFKSSMGKLK